MCGAICIGNTQQTQKKNVWSFIQSRTSTQEGTEIRFFCCPFQKAL